MKKGFKQELQDLETMIWHFERLVLHYPDNEPYRNSLAELRTERAELVSTIGRKAKK